jgi:hypothetical protein
VVAAASIAAAAEAASFVADAAACADSVVVVLALEVVVAATIVNATFVEGAGVVAIAEGWNRDPRTTIDGVALVTWRESIFAGVLCKSVSKFFVMPVTQTSSTTVRLWAWRFCKGSSFEPTPCNVNAEPCVVDKMFLFLLLFEELQASPLCCWEINNRSSLIRSV